MIEKQVNKGNAAGVGLLLKALQLLDLFQQDRPYWTQAELSRATGVTRSTTSRLARFLCEQGYLMELEPRGRYSLGPAAIDLGRRAALQLDMRAIYQPVIEEVARQTGETVLATALSHNAHSVACIGQVESTQEGLRVFETIGATFPLHAGAVAKAVLAFLPPDECERYLARDLERKTSFTLVDPVRLRQDNEETRRRGYAVSRQETYLGVYGIAAPTFRHDGRPAGSVGIACPMFRTNEPAIARFGALVVEAAAKVSAQLAGQINNNGKT